MADTTKITSGSLSYTGEEGYEKQKARTGGGRPALLPRNGPVKVGHFSVLELVKGKSDKSVTNIHGKAHLVPIDKDDPVAKGTVIEFYTMISGNYSERAKLKPGQPRIHILRDFLLSCGIPEKTVISKIPIGKGKVDLAWVSKALAQIVAKGKGAAANAYAEEGNGKYAGTWTTSLTSWIPPEEFKEGLVGGYESPLQPAALAYLKNPTAAKKDIDVGDDLDEDALEDADDLLEDSDEDGGDDEGVSSDEDDLFE